LCNSQTHVITSEGINNLSVLEKNENDRFKYFQQQTRQGNMFDKYLRNAQKWVRSSQLTCRFLMLALTVI